MKEFELWAMESAPFNYPMQIVSGSLIYHDGSGSIYIPDRSTIDAGWGQGISYHDPGEDKKPLPDQLKITFFSYTENQFYQGRFDLPYEKMLKMFQQGYIDPYDRKHINYKRVIVGVAPGGAVAVWLRGVSKITEVFYGQAEKIDGDWGWINTNPDYTREEYIRLDIEESLETPEALAALQQNGVPVERWPFYHKTRYHWQPYFTGMKARDDLIYTLKFYNGEFDYLYVPLDKKLASETRAVPSDLYFTWNPTGYLVNDRVVKSYFDEAEIFAAFEKLGKHNQPLKMELRMEPEKNYDFTIWLHNDKESIELKKTRVKTWKPSGQRYENAGPEDTE